MNLSNVFATQSLAHTPTTCTFTSADKHQVTTTIYPRTPTIHLTSAGTWASLLYILITLHNHWIVGPAWHRMLTEEGVMEVDMTVR